MTIDISRLVGAVGREVSTREFNGKPARAVVASRVYDTTVDDLWDAITNPERIPRWFLPISGDLRLGGRYQLEGNAGGEITRCEPPHHLALSWEFAGDTSWVEVALSTAASGGATLRLEHIAHIPDDDKFWVEYGPGATGVGWELALWGIELHLTKNAPMDPKQAEAWLGTGDGKIFIRRSSDAWCQAAIDAGDDSTAAAEAAQRTTAFYGGE